MDDSDPESLVLFRFPLGVDDCGFCGRLTLGQAYGLGAWVWAVVIAGLIPEG